MPLVVFEGVRLSIVYNGRMRSPSKVKGWGVPSGFPVASKTDAVPVPWSVLTCTWSDHRDLGAG